MHCLIRRYSLDTFKASKGLFRSDSKYYDHSAQYSSSSSKHKSNFFYVFSDALIFQIVKDKYSYRHMNSAMADLVLRDRPSTSPIASIHTPKSYSDIKPKKLFTPSK